MSDKESKEFPFPKGKVTDELDNLSYVIGLYAQMHPKELEFVNLSQQLEWYVFVGGEIPICTLEDLIASQDFDNDSWLEKAHVALMYVRHDMDRGELGNEDTIDDTEELAALHEKISSLRTMDT